MESRKCDRCKKVIEGYTEIHVDTLMAQHMIKHDNEDKKKKEKEDGKNKKTKCKRISV